MRVLLFFVLAMLGGCAFARPSVPVRMIAEAIRQSQAPQRNPLEPSGFAPLRVRSRELPAPMADSQGAAEILKSGEWKKEGDVVFVTGGAHVRYRGYDLFGESLELDTVRDIGVIRGDARVLGQEAVVKGQKITVNFEQRTYFAESADVVLRPFPGRFEQDLFLRGAEAWGSERESFGRYCNLTSCDKEHPHYHLDADRMTVRPNKRAILRQARIRVLDRTVIGVPYLSIPLERRSERYLPEVGQSQDEGYFAKFALPIATSDDRNDLAARFDYFTKLGVGVGANYLYEGRQSEGQLRLYTLTGRDQTAELQSLHRQRIGSLDLTLNNNYQRQNYLNAPLNTLWNSQLQLAFRQSQALTTLSYYRSQNDSEAFNNISQTYSLADQRTWSRTTRTVLDLTLSDFRAQFGGGSSERSQLDLRFRGTHELRTLTAELEYLRSIPVGETQNFFSGSDRTPVLSLRSDSRRLLGSRWSEQLPIQAELSVGEYSNPVQRNRISRGAIDVQIQRSDPGRQRFGVSADARYRQGIYSDDTAQYSLGLNSAARYRLGRQTGLNLRYSYLDSFGFTPLDFDRIGRYHFASGDVLFEPLRHFRVGAQTGYDFALAEQQEVAWQSVGVRTEWTPLPDLNVRTLSTYDPFLQSWSNVRLDGAYRVGSTYVAAGARYDAIRKVWGNLNLFVDGLQFGRLRVSTLLSYNGYLREFEARHFNFTYDLHCAEAILQILDYPVGFRSGRTINFFIRLKALPWDTGFGTGRRGTSFGTGTGRDGF